VKPQINKKLHTILTKVEDLALKEHELSRKFYGRRETPLLGSVKRSEEFRNKLYPSIGLSDAP
jgi:hypothetical protein